MTKWNEAFWAVEVDDPWDFHPIPAEVAAQRVVLLKDPRVVLVSTPSGPDSPLKAMYEAKQGK